MKVSLNRSLRAKFKGRDLVEICVTDHRTGNVFLYTLRISDDSLTAEGVKDDTIVMNEVVESDSNEDQSDLSEETDND